MFGKRIIVKPEGRDLIEGDLQAQSNLFNVFVDKDFVFKDCECILFAKVDCDHSVHKENSFIFTPSNEKLEKNNVICAHEVVCIDKDFYVPVRLLSLDGNGGKIYKGTKIGELNMIENSPDVALRAIHLTSDVPELTLTELFEMHVDQDQRNELNRNYLIQILKKFKNVFSKTKQDLGFSDVVKHKIDTGDSYPINMGFRRVPIAMEKEVERLVLEMKEGGIIRDSCSPWNSPIVLVRKKNNEIRFCIDYRRLNYLTKRPIFPIPDCQQLFDTLHGSEVFSALDLSQGYYQVAMDEDDIPKTAFTTKSGQYEFIRMPFGLSGAPATFQRVMHQVLKSQNWKSCLIYLDDVLVFGKDEKEHFERLYDVLSTIEKAGLKLSPKKCNFMMPQVKYLGHIISKRGISTDPEKIEKVKNFIKPNKEKDLISFLGLCGYYRKFIKNYSVLVHPLENICKHCTANKIINWNDEALEAFNVLKQKLTTAPILSFPCEHGDYILDTDASHDTIGAVLSQIQDGDEKVICYASHRLTKSEKEYCTTRKELLAVYKYVHQFKHYLHGKKFKVRTDHRALTWLLKWNNPNTSQYCRWQNSLQLFDMEIEYRKGKEHTNADFMSRIPCEQCEIKHDDPKKKRNVKIINEETTIRKMSIQEMYLHDQSKDDDILKVTELMKKKKLEQNNPDELKLSSEEAKYLWKHRKNLRIRGDSLYFLKDGQYRLIVPKHKRNELILTYHRDLGHIGIWKTFHLLQSKYHWMNMMLDIKITIGRCKACQFCKLNNYGATELQPVITTYPFERIAIDIAGPLPRTRNGHTHILGIIDYFSKYPMLIPIKDTTSKTIAKVLLNRWISVFGSPKSIHSDRGANIDSEFIREVVNLLGIDKSHTTPYHPNSDGLVERLFRTSKELVRCCLFENKCQDWAESLPLLEIGLRSSPQKSTNFTPFEVVFGKEMNTHLNLTDISPQKGNDEYIVWLKNEFKRIHGIVQANIEKNGKKMERKYSNLSSQLEIGDLVLVKIINRNKNVFGPRYYGPLKIIKKLGKHSYRLQDTTRNNKIVDRHRSHLKKYNEGENDEKSNGSQTSIQSLSHNQPGIQYQRGNVNQTNKERTKRLKFKPERYGYS